MAKNSRKKIFIAIGAVFLFFALVVGSRLVWMAVGPPQVDSSASPEQELNRLTELYRQDEMKTQNMHYDLQKRNLDRAPWAVLPMEFFYGTNNAKYAQCFLELAQKDPQSAFARVALYQAIHVDNGRASQQAFNILITRYHNDRVLRKFIGRFHNYDPAFATAQLKRLVGLTSIPDTKALANCMLAQIVEQSGKEEEAIKYYEQAREDLRNCRPGSFPGLEAEISVRLGALGTTRVGMKAPEIVGLNQDGKTVRLSDFKNKVVYLDFFADW